MEMEECMPEEIANHGWTAHFCFRWYPTQYDDMRSDEQQAKK